MYYPLRWHLWFTILIMCVLNCCNKTQSVKASSFYLRDLTAIRVKIPMEHSSGEMLTIIRSEVPRYYPQRDSSDIIPTQCDTVGQLELHTPLCYCATTMFRRLTCKQIFWWPIDQLSELEGERRSDRSRDRNTPMHLMGLDSNWDGWMDEFDLIR